MTTTSAIAFGSSLRPDDVLEDVRREVENVDGVTVVAATAKPCDHGVSVTVTWTGDTGSGVLDHLQLVAVGRAVEAGVGR